MASLCRYERKSGAKWSAVIPFPTVAAASVRGGKVVAVSASFLGEMLYRQ